jgi:xanthine dehydrogenase accessory factor
MDRATDILGIISARKAAGEPFALATVVRTVAATAAKAGAKAVILPDGTISEGWIGGGCARAAVLKAARAALSDGKSRLVSVQPSDLLDQQGHAPGEEQGGVRFAKNMCPSQARWIYSWSRFCRDLKSSFVDRARCCAVADFARRAGFAVTACAPAEEQAAFGDIDRRIEGYALSVDEPGTRYIVVSTQGRGDEAALLAALAVDADYIAFVGSRKKADSLKASLGKRGISDERLAKLKAPAGLDLGAITPEEIAISKRIVNKLESTLATRLILSASVTMSAKS